MENQSHAFVAGLFVLVLGAAVVAGALWLGAPKGPRLSPIDLITAHSVVGLTVNAPVQFRGVDIGRVESIAFDPHRLGQIRVRIGVDPAAPISLSTFAKLSYQGITGVAFIQLDDAVGTSGQPQALSFRRIVQMELRASFLERAEDDAHDMVIKAGRIANRVDELLGEPNQKRFTQLMDSMQHTVERYGVLGRDLEPSAKALPVLLAQLTRTVESAQSTADTVTSLARDVDRRLVILDEFDRDTLPRVNALLDEVAMDARELKRTLHEVNARPQSLIFGPQVPPPGPGERGFVEAIGAAK